MQTEKLSISLPSDMAQMIRRRVESGAYASNSEVIREALRGWHEREQERESRLQVIREKLEAAANNPIRFTLEDVDRHIDALYEHAMKARNNAA